MSVDTSHKIPFDNHLKSPCQLSFQFQYTTPVSIEKIIGDLKHKSSAGYHNLSSKLLKDIKGIISRPLSILIKQSLCSGIFPSKLKLAKVIPLYKKKINESLVITGQYLCYLQYLRYLKKLHLNRSSSILHPVTFFLRVNTGSAKTILQN